MSPIIDLQRRHAELFRIRLGEQKVSAKGKKYPAALDGQIRVTSRSLPALEAIAARYGGEPRPWQDQHEAYLPTAELRIVVLPGDSVVQWWESWRAKDGGMPVCVHRCDGEWDHASDARCACPPVAERLADRERWCAPTTRLSVILPDVDLIGAGVLVSRGRVAAETLPQAVDVLRAALERGEMVPATLRVVKVESSGKSFVVPRIEVVGVSLAQLLGGSAPALPPSRASEGGEQAPVAGPPTSEPFPPSGQASGPGRARRALESPPESWPDGLARTSATQLAYDGLRAKGVPADTCVAVIESQEHPFTVAAARGLVDAYEPV